MISPETYPFGRPIGPVTSSFGGRRPVVIVGVYPSAVHATWRGPDSRVLVRALAVADEPEPFWTGEGADQIVDAISRELPEGVGSLVPVGMNGVSGQALDRFVLEPLEITRSHVRVVDLHNRYLANPAQQAAVDREYKPRIQTFGLPEVRWTLRAGLLSLRDDRSPSFCDEIKEAESSWIITLGDEPARALTGMDLDMTDYGRPRRVTVCGQEVRLLPLAHTRQTAGHGRHSSEWRATHERWIETLAPEVADELKGVLS